MANRMVTGHAGKKKASGTKKGHRVRHMSIERAENGVKVDTHYMPPEGGEGQYQEPTSAVFKDDEHQAFADHVMPHFFPDAGKTDKKPDAAAEPDGDEGAEE